MDAWEPGLFDDDDLAADVRHLTAALRARLVRAPLVDAVPRVRPA